MEYNPQLRIFCHPRYGSITKEEIWDRLNNLEFTRSYIGSMIVYLRRLEHLPERSGRPACKKFLKYILEHSLLFVNGIYELLFLIYSHHPNLVNIMIREKYKRLNYTIRQDNPNIDDSFSLIMFFRSMSYGLCLQGEKSGDRIMTIEVEKTIKLALMLGFDLAHPRLIDSVLMYHLDHLRYPLGLSELRNTIFQRIMTHAIMSGLIVSSLISPPFIPFRFEYSRCTCQSTRPHLGLAYACRCCDRARILSDSFSLFREITLFELLLPSLYW